MVWTAQPVDRTLGVVVDERKKRRRWSCARKTNQAIVTSLNFSEEFKLTWPEFVRAREIADAVSPSGCRSTFSSAWIMSAVATTKIGCSTPHQRRKGSTPLCFPIQRDFLRTNTHPSCGR